MVGEGAGFEEAEEEMVVELVVGLPDREDWLYMHMRDSTTRT